MAPQSNLTKAQIHYKQALAVKGSSSPAHPAVRLQPNQRAHMFNMMRDNSRFMEVEQVSDLLPANLDNSILPVFRQENFPNAEYSALLPVVRLASLQLDFALRQKDSILVKIVAGSHQLISLNERNWFDASEQYAYPDVQSGSFAEQASLVQETANSLDRLADLITFLPFNDTTKGGAAFCEGDEYRSTVTYSQSRYKQLVQLTKSGQDPAFLTVLRCELATTLAHETVHALTNAQELNVKTGNEAYASVNAHEAPLAEVGFAFESQVYGGGQVSRMYHGNRQRKGEQLRRHQYPDGSYSGIQGIVVMWEYPYKGIATLYQHHDLRMGCRTAFGQRAGPDLAWRVSIRHLSKMLNKGFWQNEVALRGQAALQPPKQVGHFFETIEDITYPAWLLSMHAHLLPAGYSKLPSHDIARTEDTSSSADSSNTCIDFTTAITGLSTSASSMNATESADSEEDTMSVDEDANNNASDYSDRLLGILAGTNGTSYTQEDLLDARRLIGFDDDFWAVSDGEKMDLGPDWSWVKGRVCVTEK